MKKIIITVIALIAAGSNCSSQGGQPCNLASQASRVAAASQESSPQVRQNTFEKVWQIVRDTFYDPNFNGVDWNKVHEQYRPLAAAARTDAELHEVLKRMLGELHVSHMGIITPEEIAKLSAPPVTTGLGLQMVEGEVVVVRTLPGSSAERMGLRPGYLIKQIDGVDVKDLKDALPKLRGAANTSVRVSYLDEHDQLRESVLQRSLLGPEEIDRQKVGHLSMYALLVSKRLENGIGYIRFSSFIASLKKKLDAAIDSMQDASGLIVDLRGNGGGDDSVAIAIANHFFEKPTVLMITRTRKGDLDYYKARPTSHPYLKPVVFLVDDGSGSASEQLTAGLQEAGRAYIIGQKTDGEDLDADLAKLPTGAYLLYAMGQPRTPKGVVIEGRGVVPDLEVSLTRRELLKGNDEQLSAAIKYIKSKSAQ